MQIKEARPRMEQRKDRGGEKDVRGSMEQDEEWAIDVMSQVMAFSPGDRGTCRRVGCQLKIQNVLMH